MNDETPVTKRDLIEQKFDKVFPQPSGVRVAESGALSYASMTEVIEAAKMMSMSGSMIPGWLQGNPGACWAILIQASHWGFEPVAVARMAYEVTDKEGRKRVDYMSQLIHALIEARAPLRQRLRFTFAGEGETRACTCSGHIKGELDPLEYTTPPLSKITPKRSSLWNSDPDQQLAYYASRSWCRRYCPDVLMGIHDVEEQEEAPRMKDVTPSAALHNRLAAANADGGTGEGYSASAIEETLNSVAGGGSTEAETVAPAPEATAEPETRQQAPEAEGGGKGKKAKAPKPPKTAAQYREHVRAWLMEHKTEQAIWEQWRSEMRLRNQCQVTEEIKDSIRAEFVEPRIAALRKK